ncbi:MAG: electron transfer flavoprotein subunit alpha/FixB family protein [Candidatus Heimdallarchaeota archaeon]|nr:electron transfer flavoprotein subunit alpha/FixB family protein [Candidatus Heimdallarchaeota archaeon]
MMKTLVFIQIRDDKIEENTLGILNKVKTTFASGEIVGALLGKGIKSEWIEELGLHGIKQVFTADDPELEVYLSATYAKTMMEIIKQVSPNFVIAAGTVYGEDLIPRLAVRNSTSCAQRVVDFTLQGETLHFHTPVRNDQAMKVTKVVGNIAFATSRTGAFFIDEAPSGSVPEVTNVSITFDDKDKVVKHIEIKKAERTVNLKDAKIIVAAGRGVGGKENFQIIRELADLLGGQIGATRACTDVHWVEETYEIGQTGQSVSPDLYIAAGISGAPQHMSGVKAKTLIVINKDEGAPIINYADYVIIGDMHTILPILKKKIQ